MSVGPATLGGVVRLEDPTTWPQLDAIGATMGLDPVQILRAYRHGVFPMPLGHGVIGWFSPMRRGILPLDGLQVTRSLRKSRRRYTVTVDQAFGEVLDRCADPTRPHGWIDDMIGDNYRRLHRLGAAHSVETWDAQGRLVGGLYGVAVGGLFAGESMFHDPEHGRDASKVALVRLVEILSAEQVCGRLLDVQWCTPHLASLGVTEVPRERYLDLLATAVALPPVSWPSSGDTASQ